MGWEQRGNNRYYYKKERNGSTVKSVYVGNGEIAHMIAQIQVSSPMVERLARLIKSPYQEAQEIAEVQIVELDQLIRVITHATLLTAGFHTHKRQWRKTRNGRATRNSN